MDRFTLSTDTAIYDNPDDALRDDTPSGMTHCNQACGEPTYSYPAPDHTDRHGEPCADADMCDRCGMCRECGETVG